MGANRTHITFKDMDITPDEDDDFTDIREQIFHNTVREQIVRIIKNTFFLFIFDFIT